MHSVLVSPRWDAVEPDGLGLGRDGKADTTHKDTRHTRIYLQVVQNHRGNKGSMGGETSSVQDAAAARAGGGKRKKPHPRGHTRHAPTKRTLQALNAHTLRAKK